VDGACLLAEVGSIVGGVGCAVVGWYKEVVVEPGLDIVVLHAGVVEALVEPSPVLKVFGTLGKSKEFAFEKRLKKYSVTLQQEKYFKL